MKTITMQDFCSDIQGASFTDVVNDNRIVFQEWLDFFNDEARQIRLEDSETHHCRPALAGVIRELEQHHAFIDFLANNDAHTTRRGRQAIGVIVRIIMEMRGWKTTGRKGSLGQRTKVATGTQTPGAYYNTSGLSRWLTKAEHYVIDNQ